MRYLVVGLIECTYRSGFWRGRKRYKLGEIMDSMRSWFSKLKSKEKVRPSRNKETTSNTRVPAAEEAPSNVTKQKVAAAKQYIENHYKKQMKSLQERKERYSSNASSYGGQV